MTPMPPEKKIQAQPVLMQNEVGKFWQGECDICRTPMYSANETLPSFAYWRCELCAELQSIRENSAFIQALKKSCEDLTQLLNHYEPANLVVKRGGLLAKAAPWNFEQMLKEHEL